MCEVSFVDSMKHSSRRTKSRSNHDGTRRVSAKTRWGSQVGYSRAVRKGTMITVSGTTATNSHGVIFGKNDPYKQTTYAIRKIESALVELEASIRDVVRTRIYTTDISFWPEIGRAHRQFFGKVKPASTIVQVSRLIHPDLLVEIEVDAVSDS